MHSDARQLRQERTCVEARVDELQRHRISVGTELARVAWANRQLLTHQIRKAFETALSAKLANWQLRQIYDIAHNIGSVV